MTLSERFRRLLACRSMTISEVAEIAGMSKQQAHQIIGGSNPNPGIQVVERLAGAMGVTLAELFADDYD